MMAGLPAWKPTRPTAWQTLRRNPSAATATWLYHHRPAYPSGEAPSDATGIRVVCISDTHCTQPSGIPEGDVLVHAGDLTDTGSFAELQAQLTWLAALPHAHKVVIAGNHDRLLDADFVATHPERIIEEGGVSRADLKWNGITYLQNSSVTFTFPADNLSSNGHTVVSGRYTLDDPTARRRLTIYGSPWTPLCGVFAFQYPPIRNVWTDRIPKGADVVVTHGPPKGYLDRPGPGVESKGCPHLLREIARARPRLVVFGHIHAGWGRETVRWTALDQTFSQFMCMDEDLEGPRESWIRWRTVARMMVWWLVTWLQTMVGWNTRHRREEREPMTTMLNAAMGADGMERGRHAALVEL